MKRMHWAAAWGLQIVILAAAYTGLVWISLALAFETGYLPYDVCMWGLMPLIGGAAAYRATVRGLLNYAAWIAPPVLMWMAHFFLSGFSPSMGPLLTAAFIGIVGAAAGEVRRQRIGARTTKGGNGNGKKSDTDL